MSYREPRDGRTRIDARPRHHIGAGGQVVGGTIPAWHAANGTPYDGSTGTRKARGSWAQPGSRQGVATGQDNASSPVNATTGQSNGTIAANGNALTQRQNLFKEMEKSGSSGLTPEMRAKARAMGVTDGGFNSAAAKIAGNESFMPASGTPPNATPTVPLALPPPVQATPAPSWKTPPALTATQVGAQPFNPGQDAKGLTPQIAANTPGVAPAGVNGQPRINRLTGKPFGYRPEDEPPPRAIIVKEPRQAVTSSIPSAKPGSVFGQPTADQLAISAKGTFAPGTATPLKGAVTPPPPKTTATPGWQTATVPVVGNRKWSGGDPSRAGWQGSGVPLQDALAGQPVKSSPTAATPAIKNPNWRDGDPSRAGWKGGGVPLADAVAGKPVDTSWGSPDSKKRVAAANDYLKNVRVTTR